MKISVLLDGLSLGAIYAMIALGYTMVYGIAKLLNFAHGDIIMVGAYSVVITVATLGNMWLGIAIAVALCTVMGVVVERLAYRPLRGASPLAVLITAIGVSYMLQGLAQLIFGAEAKPFTRPAFFSKTIGALNVSYTTIITLLACTVIMVLLTVFVKFTKTGRAMQAVSEDRGAAMLMGINVNKIITLTFAIGSCLAAFAGFFYLLQIPSANPTFGSLPGIMAFTAAVIGGIGSIPGAMLGGVMLGLIEKISQSIPGVSDYTTAIEFGLLILILLIKPIGLLGKKRRVKV